MTKLCFNFDRTQKRGTRRTITKKILQEKLFPNFFRGRITPRNLFSQFLFSFGFKSTIIIYIFTKKLKNKDSYTSAEPDGFFQNDSGYTPRI